MKLEEEKLAGEEEAAKDDKAGGSNNDREGGPDGTRKHLPTLVNEPSTEEADGSEESLDEGMGEVQEMARLKKEKDSALEAQQAAEQESRSISEQATKQVNALCENLQESDEKVEAMQKMVDSTKRVAEDSHVKMKICEAELRKAVALLSKKRGEGEAKNGKPPEGGEANNELKTESPGQEARRGAETATMPWTVEATSSHDCQGKDEKSV